MEMGLAGAAVCVSGGTKGLGRAAALAFAQEGARVVVSGRGEGPLAETVEALLEAGSPDAFGIQCDILEPDSILSMFGRIESRWGGLNTLINMAAVTGPGDTDFTGVSDETWRTYLDGGLMSAVRCTRAAVPLMRKAGWGRVVNVSSISARLGIPQEAPYMAAKAALGALTKNMGWALARENILVNAVSPGVFRSDGMADYVRALDSAGKYDPEDLEDLWRFTCDRGGARYGGVIGRVGRAEELAPVLLLLGSQANSYMVGVNIAVDGGTDFSAG